jgi:hypothetical protein
MAMLSQSNDEMRMNALTLIVVSRVRCSSINRFAGLNWKRSGKRGEKERAALFHRI